jgi:hypothetical protein
MSFGESIPVSIPLQNPVSTYGETFRVSNIYLTSSSDPTNASVLPSGTGAHSLFQQNFQNKYINLHWDVIDPKSSYVYKNSGEIIDNPYISGFNVVIYENSGSGTGYAAATGSRTKIHEASGIQGNRYNYILSGTGGVRYRRARTRNISVEVTLTDFTGNRRSGSLVAASPPPVVSLTTTGLTGEYFYSNYSGGGPTLQRMLFYHFTGLTSGESGYFSQGDPYMSGAYDATTGNNNYASIELVPGRSNYIMALPEDYYNTGDVLGFFTPQTVQTGIGFTGLTGDVLAPYLVPYFPQITNITGTRFGGGNGLYFTFSTNYDTGNSNVTTCYKLHATGDITGAVSGYSGEILGDYGVLLDDTYNYSSPPVSGWEYVYDNGALWATSGLYTGTQATLYMTGVETGLLGSGITGVISGLTGSGIFGYDAGYLWEESSPIYEIFSMSGVSGDNWPTGQYTYTLFNPESQLFSSDKGMTVEGRGIFSMPKDDPNSYNINYRNGPDVWGTYEKAASYLNSIGEMPAVILNRSQLKRAQSVSRTPGWVGLRRRGVGLLAGLFSEDSFNDNFFSTTLLTTGVTRDVSIVNLSGYTETSRIEVNDIGDYWAWTNGSGSAIYKYAGSGYNKLRQATLEMQIKGLSGEFLTGASGTGVAPFMNMDTLVAFSGEKRLSFQYTFNPTYFDAGVTTGFQENNLNVNQLNLYTGASLGFEVSTATLAQQYGYNMDFQPLYSALTGYQTGITYSPPIDNEEPPGFYKVVSFDSIGSGAAANVNQIIADENGTDPNIPISVATSDQLTIVSLDAAYTAGNNHVTVRFPFTHEALPAVTQSLLYTGTVDSPVGYLGAMLSGRPTTSGASFILTDKPPATGYALYVRSASFTN